MVFTTNLRTFPSRFLFIKIQKRFSRINLKFFRKGYTTTQLRSGFHLKRRLYLIGLSTYFILIVTRIVRRYEYSSQTTNLVPIKRLINKHIELIIMFSLDIHRRLCCFSVLRFAHFWNVVTKLRHKNWRISTTQSQNMSSKKKTSSYLLDIIISEQTSIFFLHLSNVMWSFWQTEPINFVKSKSLPKCSYF